jgi:hypothetical protein
MGGACSIHKGTAYGMSATRRRDVDKLGDLGIEERIT